MIYQENRWPCFLGWLRPLTGCLLPSAFGSIAAVAAQPTGKDRLDNYVDWAIYRGDKKANQYSSLGQINATNVHRLELAWEYHHGDPNGPSMYSNPIVVDGLLYFTTAKVNAVALDAATGKQVWVFESAKYNAGQRVFRGRNRGLVYWEDARGEKRRIFNFVKDRVYAIEAKSGALIESFGEAGFIDLRKNLPVEERPVPASKVPGEEAWPTQPFPTKPPPLVRLATYEADLTNVTPESRASALEQFRKHETGFLYTPASLRGTITTPGHQGGVEWGGGAFDPTTGVLYVNANEAPKINRLKPLTQIDPTTATPMQRGAMTYNMACTPCHGFNRQGNPPLYPPLKDVRLRLKTHEIRTVLLDGRGIMPSFAQLTTQQLDDLITYLESNADDGQDVAAVGTGRYAQIAPFFEDPYGAPAISPPWGTLNAIDLNQGEILWKVPLGEYPQLAAKGIRNTGAKNFGGPILTAGGIIFIAATPDEKSAPSTSTRARCFGNTNFPPEVTPRPALSQSRGNNTS